MALSLLLLPSLRCFHPPFPVLRHSRCPLPQSIGRKKTAWPTCLTPPWMNIVRSKRTTMTDENEHKSYLELEFFKLSSAGLSLHSSTSGRMYTVSAQLHGLRLNVCALITFSCPSLSSTRAAVKAVGSTTDNTLPSSTLTAFCARGGKEGWPSTHEAKTDTAVVILRARRFCHLFYSRRPDNIRVARLISDTGRQETRVLGIGWRTKVVVTLSGALTGQVTSASSSRKGRRVATRAVESAQFQRYTQNVHRKPEGTNPYNTRY